MTNLPTIRPFNTSTPAIAYDFWTGFNLKDIYGSFTGIVVDPLSPNTLYVGTTSDGVLKSTDGGGNWKTTNNDLVDHFNMTVAVYTLALDPFNSQTLYAGTNNGIYKSVDGGESWAAKNNGLRTQYGYCDDEFCREGVYALAIDPFTPGTVYAGTENNGIFKSVDGGETWSEKTANRPMPSIDLLVVDPTTPGTLYAGGSQHGKVIFVDLCEFYKTTDSGEEWYGVSQDLTGINALVIDPMIKGTMVAENSLGVYQSKDGGIHWVKVNSDLPRLLVSCLVIDTTEPATLYAGTYGHGVFKSTDGGVTWLPFNDGLEEEPLVSTMTLVPGNPTILYAGIDYRGLFYVKINHSE